MNNANEDRLQQRLKRWKDHAKLAGSIWTALPSGLRKLIGTCLITLLLGMAFGINAWLLRDRKVTASAAGVTFVAEAEQNADRARSAAHSATTDASRIAEIATRLDGQRDTIDAAFRTASEAKRLSDELTNRLGKADTVLRRMETNSTFVELASAAEAGDRPAWDKLRTFADDPNHPFRERAVGVYRGVQIRYGSPELKYWFGRYPGAFEKAGLTATNVTLAQVRLLLPMLGIDTQLETLQFVTEQSRFGKKEKLLFFREIRRESKSLEVCAWAGRHFNALAPMPGVTPLADDVMDDWLKENLDKIKE